MREQVAVVLTVLLIALVVSCGKGDKGVYASGTVEAREVLVSAKVAGTVQVIHVKRSQAVKAGDLMVERDPQAYELQQKEAEAALAAAEQLLLKAQRGLRPEEIDQAGQAVTAAEAQAKLANNTLGRQEKLFATGSISQQDIDVVRSQSQMADAQLRATRKQLEVARKGARVEDIEAARQQAERARAAVELVKLQASYSKVTSPDDLTVSEIYVEQGELAAPGTALALLQDLTDFYVDVFVPISQLSKVQAGDQVKIRVTGFPDREFRGVVERVKPRAEFTPENVTTEEGRSHLVFKVRVKITEGQESLKPGLPADAWILPNSAGGK
jgi:HlyD family secretion protein